MRRQEGPHLRLGAPFDDLGHVVDLDGVAHAAQVLTARVAVLQVQGDGLDAGLRPWLGDDEPAAGPRRICAIEWYSSSRTASRNTARLTW